MAALGSQSPRGFTSSPVEPGASRLHLFWVHLILAKYFSLKSGTLGFNPRGGEASLYNVGIN